MNPTPEHIKIVPNFSEHAHPVSVIVSVIPSRMKFFMDFGYYSILNNGPAEIIINTGSGTAAEKWNESFSYSQQPYVYLVSDDFILPVGQIAKFIKVLYAAPENVGYAYPSNYWNIPVAPDSHDIQHVFNFESKEFNAAELRKANYIDGSCMWRRECWVNFDTNLKRLLDWDVALTNLARGIIGVRVPDTRFLSFNLDKGLSRKENDLQDAIRAIKAKHNL